ncbi:MAG TPA: hypothetical protein VN428_07880 [Bryobacteraceae bacterium]|nr:hypothetical protein [Bryobacteraceae bacterium]
MAVLPQPPLGARGVPRGARGTGWHARLDGGARAGEPPPDWRGETGFIDRDVLQRHLPGGRTDLHYLVCGPAPMIRLAERSLDGLGIEWKKLHSERFDLA